MLIFYENLFVEKYGSMVEKWNHVGNIMRFHTVIRFDYECLFFSKKRDIVIERIQKKNWKV